MQIWHVNLGLETHEVLVRDGRGGRAWVRSLRRFLGDVELLAASLPDNHGHLLVAHERVDLGQRVHALECSLRWHLRLDAAFRPAFFKAVEDQRHLRSAFDYVLRNDRRHGSLADPARGTTNLPDLLGAREELDFTRAAVRARLPRVGREQLLGLVGFELGEGSDWRLLEAAAEGATVAGLWEGGQRGRQARRVAAALGIEAGLVRAELAERLRTRPGDLTRLAGRADPELLRAARVQLAWLDGARQAGRAS